MLIIMLINKVFYGKILFLYEPNKLSLIKTIHWKKLRQRSYFHLPHITFTTWKAWKFPSSHNKQIYFQSPSIRNVINIKKIRYKRKITQITSAYNFLMHTHTHAYFSHAQWRKSLRERAFRFVQAFQTALIRSGELFVLRWKKLAVQSKHYACVVVFIMSCVHTQRNMWWEKPSFRDWFVGFCMFFFLFRWACRFFVEYFSKK